MRRIRGSGGGGESSAPSRPQEAKDTLQSRAYARIMDLISEGEIVGLVNGKKSIFLNDTAVEDSAGNQNFPTFDYDFNPGTQAQGYMIGYDSNEAQISVGVELKENIPVVRTFTNEIIDAVKVVIAMPQMVRTDQDTGNLEATDVRYKIYLQSNGAGYVEKVDGLVDGKSTSKYQIAHRIDFEGPGPWDIKVVRMSDDADTTERNQTYWESYIEVVESKLRYPNSALIGLNFDSAYFSSVPRRSYDIKGLKIKIPSNATVRADGSLTYSGTWDGTFQIAWSSNPAWVLYDLLTSTRYGLGNFIPESQVDKWSLYSIGQYCDELVPNGSGGTEPRFLCNCYLQTRAEAFQVVQDIASAFRGMLYWEGGAITAVADAPSDPAFLFTTANVIDGVFSYQGSSAKTRHTVALVTWNDPENNYKQAVEYVEDTEGIARYGVIETQVFAFGCTSRGQAHRAGRWLLYSERYQTETVTFRAGLEGALIRPGMVIKVQDPTRAGARLGGRVVSVSGSQITIDQTISINPSNFTFSVMLPNGSVETKTISTAAGNLIVLTSPLSVTPVAGAIWMVQSTIVEPQLFKVVGISENGDATHTITALEHNEGKYDLIENGIALQPRSISILTEVPSAPANVTLTETLYAVNADVRVKVTVSWDQVQGASSYLVSYKRDSLNEVSLGSTRANDIEILNAEPGVYTATVYAVSPLGKVSLASTGTKKIIGKALPPSPVTGFSLMPNGSLAYLSWTKSTDLDVLLGGTVRLRHTPALTGAIWKNSVDIAPALPGNATRAQVPLLPGTYMAKFVDSSGVASDEEAFVVTTIPEAYVLNVVETLTESPSFSGVKSGCEVQAIGSGGLALSPGKTLDEILTPIDDLVSWDFMGGVASLGTYDFASIVDLNDIFTSRVTANITAEAIDVADTIDLRDYPVDEWQDLDGEFIDTVNAELFMATTEDDPGGTPTWTEWKRFFVGEYKARAFKFRLVLTSGKTNHNIVIPSLSVVVDMPDRVENLVGLSSGAGTFAVVYSSPFAAIPAVGITLLGTVNSGDYYTITNKTESGFDIVFRNSAGTAVSRTFDVLAKGYGRRV